MIWGLVPITRATRIHNTPTTRLKNYPKSPSPFGYHSLPTRWTLNHFYKKKYDKTHQRLIMGYPL